MGRDHRGAVDDRGAGELGLAAQRGRDPARLEAEDRLAGRLAGQRAEEVTDGFNGWLAPNDPDEYAAKVILALGDREKLLQVGQNSQKTIFKDWEQLIDQVQLRYEDIVKSYRRSAHQAYKTRKRTVRFS